MEGVCACCRCRSTKACAAMSARGNECGCEDESGYGQLLPVQVSKRLRPSEVAFADMRRQRQRRGAWLEDRCPSHPIPKRRRVPGGPSSNRHL